jgi:hypothetical protein
VPAKEGECHLASASIFHVLIFVRSSHAAQKQLRKVAVLTISAMS